MCDSRLTFDEPPGNSAKSNNKSVERRKLNGVRREIDVEMFIKAFIIVTELRELKYIFARITKHPETFEVAS